MFKFINGSRVVFLGDSITANGTYMRRVLQYYRENTDIRFEMYNAGVSGDNATFGSARLYETVDIFNPTDIVIMFGMNDVSRLLYGAKATADNILDRRASIDKCISSVLTIARTYKNRGVRVVLCSPTVYDEMTEEDAPNLIGVESALYEIGERISAICEDSGFMFVDYNRPMLEILKKLSKNGQTYINPDRVHPSHLGHELMARIFLRDQGFDVEIPDSIEKMQSLADRPFGDWEDQRYMLERKVVSGSFIDRCLYKCVKKADNIRQLIKNFPKEQITPFMESQFELYEKRESALDENINNLKDFTSSIYGI